MKKVVCLIGFILVFVFLSCSKDDEPIQIQEPVKSSAKRITSFAFKAESNAALELNIPAVIDETTKTITAKVPFGTNVSLLSPELKYSDKATVSPVGTRDFSHPVSYTVTAEDGTQVTYSALVTIAPNGEAMILSFQFLLSENPFDNNIVARIDHEAGIIEFDVPDGSDITALLPDIQVSADATISPLGIHNFKEDLVYTVTAGDGTKADYEVFTKYSQRGVLIEMYNANPESYLDWDIENHGIDNWYGVDLDTDGNVSGLYLDAVGLKVLPREIGQLSALKELYLSYNNLFQLPSEIGELVNLTYLDLSYCSLTQLPSEIGQLESLTELVLFVNGLTTVPKEISQLTNLTALNLSYNSNLKELPEEIIQLTSLTKLKISGSGLRQLPSKIGLLSKLTKLELIENELTKLPPSIGQLTNLTDLILDENLLRQLPSEIGMLSNLNRLNLNRNRLREIPPEIGLLNNLITLHLKNNPSLTSIPMAVCNMQEGYGTTIYTDLDLHITCKE